MNALRNFFSPAKPSRVTTPRSGIEAARAALSSRALESPNVTPTPTSTPVGKAPVPVNIFDDGEISFFQRSQSIASEGASAAVAAKNAAALVCRKFRAVRRRFGSGGCTLRWWRWLLYLYPSGEEEGMRGTTPKKGDPIFPLPAP